MQSSEDTSEDKYTTCEDKYTTCEDKYPTCQYKYTTCEDKYTTCQYKYPTYECPNTWMHLPVVLWKARYCVYYLNYAYGYMNKKYTRTSVHFYEAAHFYMTNLSKTILSMPIEDKNIISQPEHKMIQETISYLMQCDEHCKLYMKDGITNKMILSSSESYSQNNSSNTESISEEQEAAMILYSLSQK